MSSYYDNDSTLLVPVALRNCNKTTLASIGELIKQHYCPNGNGKFSDNFPALIRFRSDQDFVKALIKDATFQARNNNNSVYFYEFAHHGLMGDSSAEYPGLGNVTHGEELNYLFSRITRFSRKSNADLSQFSPEDVTVHRRFTKFFVNFATHLNPTPDVTDDLLQKVYWPTVKENDFKYLHINKNLVVSGDPRKEMLQFWDGLYKMYGNEPFITF